MFKSKDYIGVDRVDRFFKHYGVKGMKWKNHAYAVDDEPVSTAKKVSMVDPALKKAVKVAGRAAVAGLSGRHSTETNLKSKAGVKLIEAYSGPRSETEAKERASRAATRSGAKAPQLIDMTEEVQKSVSAKRAARAAREEAAKAAAAKGKTLDSDRRRPKSETEAREAASAAATKSGAREQRMANELRKQANIERIRRMESEAKDRAAAASTTAGSGRQSGPKSEAEARERAARASTTAGSGRWKPKSEAEAREAAAVGKPLKSMSDKEYRLHRAMSRLNKRK